MAVIYQDQGTETKVQKVKKIALQKINDGVRWVINNKESVMIIAPIVSTVVGATLTGVNKRIKMKNERNLKELYCYDRSLGHYWKLARPLSNADWIKVNDRRKNGEKLGDILSSMKVLK